MTQRDLGILPNNVNRDHQSEAALVFGTLTDNLDQATVQQWLTNLRDLVDAAEKAAAREDPTVSVVIGFGAKFFARFPEFVANTPVGLLEQPALPASVIEADFVLHITFTSEARLADLLRGLWATRPTLVSLDIERGYARKDKREEFGQLDGVRNLSTAERKRTTRIDSDEFPEEPTWVDGGGYGAYLKIEQNTDIWAGHSQESREQIIGRRESDGSRLDLPAGTDPKTEGDFTDPSCPVLTSHLRKTGPRGSLNDRTLIFRRGHPYAEEENGTMHFGLQFVSYQASLDDLDVVLNRWMLNPNFPTLGAGQDALLSNGLLTFVKGGFFVVVPHDDRFPCAGYFDPPPAPGNHRVGRVHIRKDAVDVNGIPIQAEVGGLVFQIIDPDTGAPIGDPATTNPAGRALLTDAPLNKPLIIRENPDPRFEPRPDETIPPLTTRNTVHRVTNRLVINANPYGG